MGVISVGSKFCSGAELQYKLIEGETLGISWVLHKTAYFSLGCPNLLILTDKRWKTLVWPHWLKR